MKHAKTPLGYLAFTAICVDVATAVARWWV